MYRIILLVAAFSVAGIVAAQADDNSNNPDKTTLLGHMSDKDKPVAKETEEKPKAPESPKDPNFIPVTKLGNFEEPTHVEHAGRDKDTGSHDRQDLPQDVQQ